MAAVLHLLKSPDTTLARAVLYRSLRAGDRVTIVLLPGGVAPLHMQFAGSHQEHLIFLVVMVPHEFSLHLHQLDLKIVQLTHDPGVEAV